VTPPPARSNGCPASDGVGDRGVSDVLAFVIVFSIIITSVALVYSTGFSSIDQIREGEQQTNAVRAFEALDLSFEDLIEGKATRRGSTISMGGGQLEYTDGPDVTVTVDGWSRTVEVGSLQYSLDETTVAYENGGVFRDDDGNSVNIEHAAMTCESDRAVVTLVVIDSPSNPIGADGNVEIGMDRTSTELAYADYDGSKDVELTFTSGSTFDDGWDDHFAETDWSGNGPYECTGVSTVIVRIVEITVTYGTP
jgi:hypothetical protein